MPQFEIAESHFAVRIYQALTPRTLFILAGEASGDAHAAKLVTQLKSLAPGTRCVGMGGPRMTAAGFEAFKDLAGMQVIGFWEVAKQYGFFKCVFYELLEKLKQTRPDALICVDYPGFNLRFAAEVKKLNIPIFYYIVPQVWAWKPGRAKKMARLIERAFCVFDFEPPFFEPFGLKTEFVGHPLLDDPDPGGVSDTSRGLKPYSAETPGKSWGEVLDTGGVPEKREAALRTVAFLPGSRENEIRHHLKPMEEAFAIAQSNLGSLRGVFSIGGRHLKIVTPNTNELVVNFEGAHSRILPAAADFSVVKSGTSTLEAALAGKPMCALYKGGALSYAIARMLVNIPVFSLVNIVLGRYAVPELLQSEVKPHRIAEEIQRGLSDEKYRAKQIAALGELKSKLGGAGASRRAAEGILNCLSGR